MTLGEYLQNKIDDCTNHAIKYQKNNDKNMTTFFLNARQGFIERRENLFLEELRQEVSE